MAAEGFLSIALETDDDASGAATLPGNALLLSDDDDDNWRVKFTAKTDNETATAIKIMKNILKRLPFRLRSKTCLLVPRE